MKHIGYKPLYFHCETKWTWILLINICLIVFYLILKSDFATIYSHSVCKICFAMKIQWFVTNVFHPCYLRVSAQNEEEPSWITRLLFVILNYHLSGNHSTIATQNEGPGIKVLSCYHCTHFYKVIYVNQNSAKYVSQWKYNGL
jgi:hypothetical protein